MRWGLATATNLWSEICWMFSFCFFFISFCVEWLVLESCDIPSASFSTASIYYESIWKMSSFLFAGCVKFWNLELVCLVWLLASPQLWPCCRLFIRPLSLAWDRAPAWALAAIPSMAVGPRDSPRAARAWDFGKPPFLFWEAFWSGQKITICWMGCVCVFFFSSFFFQSFFESTCFGSAKKMFHRSSDFHQIFLSISTILHRSWSWFWGTNFIDCLEKFAADPETEGTLGVVKCQWDEQHEMKHPQAYNPYNPFIYWERRLYIYIFMIWPCNG